MSRVGKLPVIIPDGLNVKVDGDTINFDNGKISRSYTVMPNVSLSYNDKIVKLAAKNGQKNASVNVGMDRSNISNIVCGIKDPFKIVLEVNGVGYKASVNKNLVVLSLGYSHDILYALPEGVQAVFEKPNLINLSSHDKVLVGQAASEIIAFRKPEPYKGKGVKISGSKILRKEGKKK